MRKKLALVLAATLALSVFAVGCGSNDTNKEDSTTPKQEQESKDDDNKKEVVATYNGETLTLAAWWTGWSTEYYKIADGQTMTIKVKGTTNDKLEDGKVLDNPWSNWVMVLANAERGGTGYAESIVLRADKFGWGTDYVATNIKMTLNGTEIGAIDKAVDADLYSKWLADCKAGIDSEIVITRNGADFTYTATTVCGDNTWVETATWTTTAALADEMLVFITGEQCTLEIKSVEVTK